MATSRARVPTAAAGKYLRQLCKHFAHKVAVDYDDTEARVDFPFGVCRMSADAEALSIFCDAPHEQALATMHGVVERHLVQFAWRERLAGVDWERI